MSAGAAAAVVAARNNQQRSHTPGLRSVRRITENNDGLSAEEAAELAAIEAEAKGQVAKRTLGLYNDKPAGKRGRITRKPPYILDPRTSKFLAYWDLLTSLCLLYTTFITPFNVGCNWEEPTFDVLFAIDRVIGSVFAFDILLQFFLMSEKPPKHPAGTVRWVHDPAEIAKHYLFGWFSIDALSVMADMFDILAIIFQNTVNNLGALRLFRLLRLIKLARLARSSRILQRFMSRTEINYGTVEAIKHLVYMVLIMHWIACFWIFQALWLSPNGPLESWLHEKCVDAPNATYGFACEPAGQLYTKSLIHAQTFIMMGAHDGFNQVEDVLSVLIALIGFIFETISIAVIVSVVSGADPDKTEFHNTMDNLNGFMKSESLPGEMRKQLREYFHQTKHLQVARANKVLIENMSPMLQGQVVWKINERWLKHVWFLRAAEDKFMVQLSLELEAAVFAPAELCPNGHMYISHRGIALYGGKVMTTGKVWGEDIILNSAHLRSKYRARCMTYVEVYMISRDGLLSLAIKFPPTLKIIRRSAFRLAFRREMIRRAQNNIKKHNADAEIVTAESTAANQMLITISSKERHADEIQSDQEAQDKMDRNFEAAQAAAAAAELDEGGARGVGAPSASLAPLAPLQVSPSASRAGDGPGMGEMLQHLEQQRVAMSSLEIRISKQHEALLKQMEALAARVEAALPSGAA